MEEDKPNIKPHMLEVTTDTSLRIALSLLSFPNHLPQHWGLFCAA